MKSTFALLFVALCLLSALVWKLQPPTTTAGKLRLIRVSDDNPARQAQVDLFNRLHPKLDLQLDPSDNGIEKIIVQSLGGVGPDLFDAFDSYQLSAYVQAGIAWDLTDEFRKRGIDLERDVYPGILKTGIYEGRTYGMPTNIAADGIWYHKDLFKQLGVPPHKGPWKWNEFIPIAKRLTVRDSDGKPVRYGFYFDWWNWSDFFKGFGAHVYTPDGTRCTVDSPQAIAAVQLMHDLVYKYKVSSNPIEEASMATSGGFGSGSISVFGAKTAATALGGRWWLATLRSYHGLNLGVMECPYENVRQVHAYGRCTLINAASPHRQEALDALFYMAGPEYNRLVNDQADGISAFKKYDEGPGFLLNSSYPEETDNATWRDITAHAAPDDISPFVSGQVAANIINDQLDLVKSDQKSAADAMRAAAVQINQAIAKTVQDDSQLRQQFDALTRRLRGRQTSAVRSGAGKTRPGPRTAPRQPRAQGGSAR